MDPEDSGQGPSWWVYLLLCADGSYYVGSTTDLQRRVGEHQAGRGARYTRGRRPLALVASVPCLSRGDAQRLESRLKSLRRKEKARLAQGQG